VSGADAGVDAFDPVAGPWAQVFARGTSTCAVKEDGTAWCFGNNGESQLGIGPPAFSSSPAQLPGTWKTLAVGRIASCGVQLDGTLWCWGNDFYAAVPDGRSTPLVASPIKIGTDTDWVQVVVGDRHGCGRKQDNTLWCWGDNGFNQFDPSVPVSQTPMQVRANVRTMAAYQTVTNVVDLDGSLWISGQTWDGEGATGTGYLLFSTWTRVGTDNDWLSVGVGEHRTCATKSDGTMWCSGMGVFGALGNDAEYSTTTFVQVASGMTWIDAVGGLDHTCGRQQDGTAWCWGASTRGQFGALVRSTTPSKISDAKAIATGDFHTCLVTMTGVLRCAGSNHAGQIRPGAATKEVPQPKGGPYAKLFAYDRSTCSLDGAGNVECWGANDAGNLGTGGVAWHQTPKPLPGVNWSAISLGRTISLGISAGKLYWWGTEHYSDTYVDAPTPILASFVDFTQVASGHGHACALRGNGDLYCVGENDKGQLGTGDAVGRSTPVLIGAGFTQVAAGQDHTCGVQSTNILCWGGNEFGAVGDNSSTDRSSPTLVQCMGCAGRTVEKLSLGSGLTHVLMTDGTLFGWGLGNYGQIGTGGIGGSLFGVPSQTARSWSDIESGDLHVCAIDDTNALWCWGHGDEGQLGDATFDSAAPNLRRVGSDTDWASLAIGAHNSCALKSNGMRYCWGANDTGLYGDGMSWLDSFIALTPDQ